MDFKVLDSILEIDESVWNNLHHSKNPFVQHAFLAALEKHGCVSERFGWFPKHFVAFEAGQPVAAMPLYEKHNNYGEFVFDHAWYQAWQSVGLNYYPKLVSAAPYTPAVGPRLFVRSDFSDRPVTIQPILEALKDFTDEQGYSGFHILFDDAQSDYVNDREILCRHDVQFQWFNQGYEGFEDFLAALKPKKRKNIRQERRAIAEQDLTFDVLNGHSATEDDWHDFNVFYHKTFLDKFSTPTLNLDFFLEIAKTMPESLVLVMVRRKTQAIAGALMFRSDKVLYGRHWGAIEQVKHLHFETCFYQGIDYAIANGLERFEPGAGGEHKVARGFVPVKMQSSHWLSVNPFEQGIQGFLAEEKRMIQSYCQEVWQSVPYQETEALLKASQSISKW